MIKENTIDAESTRAIAKEARAQLREKERNEKKELEANRKKWKAESILKGKTMAQQQLHALLLAIQKAAANPTCKEYYFEIKGTWQLNDDGKLAFREETVKLLRAKGYSVIETSKYVIVRWLPWYKYW